MSPNVEERIAALAAAQHGAVTRRQVIEAGLTPSMVECRLRSRRLQLLHRGVYLAVPFPLERTREIAAVLACGPGAALSHVSAAGRWGLVPASVGAVHVIVSGNRGARPGIHAHRAELAQDERTTKEGIPLTTPARTLLDLAPIVDPRQLEQAVARAEREGLATPKALRELLARHRRHSGAPALRRALEAPGGPAFTRSEAEAMLLTLIRQAKLPAPEWNVSFGRYEVDCLWRSARLAVEVDGFRYHSSRQRFEGDRRKDAELVARGVTVLHLSWHQVAKDAMATAVQLALALRGAGERA